MYQILLLCLCFTVTVKGGKEGDICLLPNSEEGTCILFDKCVQAKSEAEFRLTTKVCGMNGSEPIVCCVRKDYSIYNSECSPQTPRREDMKFGRIAFEKCIEYQEQVIFPCSLEAVAADGAKTRALLGYGTELHTAEWLCGGTIISERFILTAAHCVYHWEKGRVSFIRLGILMRSDPMLVTRLYRVARDILHPGYNRSSRYHDIALLETDKRITFVNKFVAPACLDMEDSPRDDTAFASGWGELGRYGELADILQILWVTRFSFEECYEDYGVSRRWKNGIDNASQVCYGDRYGSTDTCRGDSGGPLQAVFPSVDCMIKVIGITSFGFTCGRPGTPGVYTRVRHYVPWIEAHVWPEEAGDRSSAVDEDSEASTLSTTTEI